MKKSILSFIKKFYAPVIVVAIIAAGVYFLFSNNQPLQQTLVVHPADFVQSVSVSGTVVAAQNVDLGFTQGGRVVATYAKVGDKVLAGKVLAEIENSDLKANVLQRQAALQTQQAKLAQLQEGTRAEAIAVTQAQVESDKVALEQANQAIINEINDSYIAADDAVRNQLVQFIEDATTATPELEFSVTDTQLKIKIESNYPVVEAMLKNWQQELASLNLSSDLIGAVDQAKANLALVAGLLSDCSLVLNSAIVDGSTDQDSINAWIVDVAAARSSVNSATTGLTTAVTSQKNAAATLAKDQKNLLLDQAGPTAADLEVQLAQVKAAAADLANAQAQLVKTYITAPFTGVVTKMDVKSGEIASANNPAVSMISDSIFQIESYVPEVNIANIKVGDLATTTLDAYGAEEPFVAKVVLVDPAETVRDGVSTYKVTLEFLTPDPRIRSGMTANLLVATEQKSQVIAVPQGVVVSRDGQKFVKIKVGETTEERLVTLGLISSLGQVEILSGLSDGDIVILNGASESE